MTTTQTIHVYGDGGFNPTKVAIILEELGLPYEQEKILLADIKKPAYTTLNPNGRLPTITDPNTGITLWESGAIIEYLVERYDSKDHKITFAPGSTESSHAKQWLFFQMSGQGPYFGQAAWFKMFHPEKIPSAVDRYTKEINRVTGVLEEHLKRRVNEGEDQPWLVGGICSYADLAFIPWQVFAARILTKEEYDLDSFPQVKSWMERMGRREGVQAAMKNMKALE